MFTEKEGKNVTLLLVVAKCLYTMFGWRLWITYILCVLPEVEKSMSCSHVQRERKQGFQTTMLPVILQSTRFGNRQRFNKRWRKEENKIFYDKYTN